MTARKRTPRRRATIKALLADELNASDLGDLLGVERFAVEDWRDGIGRPPKAVQRHMATLLHASRRWRKDLSELLPGRPAAADRARNRAWEASR